MKDRGAGPERKRAESSSKLSARFLPTLPEKGLLQLAHSLWQSLQNGQLKLTISRLF
jgi:hypothetical protein